MRNVELGMRNEWARESKRGVLSSEREPKTQNLELIAQNSARPATHNSAQPLTQNSAKMVIINNGRE
jgi:hypothetical protein